MSKDQRVLGNIIGIEDIKLLTTVDFYLSRASTEGIPTTAPTSVETGLKSILVSRLTSDGKKQYVYEGISDKALSQAMVVNIKSLR